MIGIDTKVTKNSPCLKNLRVLAATTAVLFILLFFMCEAIAVAGVLGMVGNTLWYVAGCEIGGGRGWVQVVGLKVGK